MSKHVIYTTLEPKFYTKLVSSITRRRKQVRRNEVHFQYTFSCALSFYVSYLSSLSKQDLKHFSKIDLLGFAGTYFSSIFAPGGRLSHEAYSVNYLLSKSKVPKM